MILGKEGIRIELVVEDRGLFLTIWGRGSELSGQSVVYKVFGIARRRPRYLRFMTPLSIDLASSWRCVVGFWGSASVLKTFDKSPKDRRRQCVHSRRNCSRNREDAEHLSYRIARVRYRVAGMYAKLI